MDKKYTGKSIPEMSQITGVPVYILGGLVKSRLIFGQKFEDEFLISDGLIPQLKKFAKSLKRKEGNTGERRIEAVGKNKQLQRRV